MRGVEGIPIMASKQKVWAEDGWNMKMKASEVQVICDIDGWWLEMYPFLGDNTTVYSTV